MNRVSKAILISAGVILGLIVIVFVGLSFYLKTSDAAARLEAELSESLSTPLKFTETHVSLFGGVRATGVKIMDATDPTATLGEAPLCTAKFRWSELFRGRIVLADMRLEKPHIVWVQNPEGEWVWPELPEDAAERERKEKEKQEKKEKKAKEDKTRVAAATPTPPPAVKPKDDIDIEFDGFEVVNATIEMRDLNQTLVALLTDVHMDFTDVGDHRAAGVANIGRLAWAEMLAMEGVRTTFSWDGKELHLPELTAAMGGGTATAKFKAKPKKDKSPFELELRFDEADFSQILEQAGYNGQIASGKISGAIYLEGSMSEVRRAEGKGALTLKDTRFSGFEMFEGIGQLLGIKEFSDLRVKDGRAIVRIADEKIFVEQMVLMAEEIRIDANGVARFDDKLSLNAQLMLREKTAEKLPSMVRENFTAKEGGWVAVDFKIGGNVSKPKADLDEKLIGRRIGNQFTDLVSGLLGLKKKNDDEEKEEKKRKKEKKKKEEKEKEKERSQVPVLPPLEPAKPANDLVPEVQ